MFGSHKRWDLSRVLQRIPTNAFQIPVRVFLLQILIRECWSLLLRGPGDDALTSVRRRFAPSRSLLQAERSAFPLQDKPGFIVETERKEELILGLARQAFGRDTGSHTCTGRFRTSLTLIYSGD